MTGAILFQASGLRASIIMEQQVGQEKDCRQGPNGVVAVILRQGSQNWGQQQQGGHEQDSPLDDTHGIRLAIRGDLPVDISHECETEANSQERMRSDGALREENEEHNEDGDTANVLADGPRLDHQSPILVRCQVNYTKRYIYEINVPPGVEAGWGEGEPLRSMASRKVWSTKLSGKSCLV